MYTANMTPAEISRETDAEIENIDKKVRHMANEFRRKALKATKFPMTMTFEQRTVRKNRWIITMHAPSKKSTEKGTDYSYYCISESPMGKYVYKPVQRSFADIFQTLVIKPHFFSRYRERMGLEETGDKLIMQMMKSKNIVKTEQFERKDGSLGFVMTFDDGIGLGDVLEKDKVHLVRTFVPKHMLFDDQLPGFLEYEADKDTVEALLEKKKRELFAKRIIRL